MEQIAIYPYSESYAPVVRHHKLIHNMQIRSLISPKGWGLSCECVKTDDAGFIVSDNFTAGIEDCSIVWFVDDAYIPLPKTLLRAKLLEALRNNKSIIFTRSAKTGEDDIRSLIPPEEEIIIETKNYLSTKQSQTCFNINTPVIFVLGLSENTDKFEVQAALREQLIKDGYEVSSVSSRQDCAILGMHPLPDFMFDEHVSETDKILLYNQLIKQIEVIEAPEVIIIGIPGGSFPFSKKINNHFGITTYEISNAVTCDCAVFCLPYLNYSLDTSTFSKISNEVNGKFGFPIDYFHISPRTYDYSFVQPLDQDFNWVTLDEPFIDSKIKTYKRKDVFNLLHTKEIENITEKIIHQLSVAPKAQSI